MLPLVSIVTPSFNQARFLEATLRSVLEQDYPRLEYIVVDGGSTDGSVEIIHRYADRLAWWVSEKDAGQADGINKGFRHASGEIVAWLNSDDIYTPGAVAAAVKAFQDNPAAGLIYGDAWSIDAEGRRFNLMRAREYQLTDLLAFNILCQPAAFMRRSALQAAGYLDTRYHLIMDNRLWIEIASQSPIVHVPQVWAAARYHAEAKNRTGGAAYGREARALLQDLSTRPKFVPMIEQNRKQIEAGVARYEAFYLTDAGQPGPALKDYARAFHLHPRTALQDWRHILLALLSLLGIQKLRGLYDRLRSRRLKLEKGAD